MVTTIITSCGAGIKLSTVQQIRGITRSFKALTRYIPEFFIALRIFVCAAEAPAISIARGVFISAMYLIEASGTAGRCSCVR